MVLPFLHDFKESSVPLGSGDSIDEIVHRAGHEKQERVVEVSSFCGRRLYIILPGEQFVCNHT